MTPTAADLHGPVTTGEITLPIDLHPVDLAAIDYVEDEWFARGTAEAYVQDDPTDPDVRVATTAPYATRLIVRRPRGEFSGVVIVEWMNVSAVENAPEWMYAGPTITSRRAAWVGVSTQAYSIRGGTPLMQTKGTRAGLGDGGLRGQNPDRYGDLEHPGDEFSFGIFGDVIAALRSPQGLQVFGGTAPTIVLAAGESQSASFLTTYANRRHPDEPIADGFFIHSRGVGAAHLDGRPGRRGRGTPVPIEIERIGVPVMVFETETDVGPTFAYASARQSDDPRLCVWEVPGTAHADAYMLGSPNHGGCTTAINDGPHRWVAAAALDALIEWVVTGTQPIRAEPIAVDTEGEIVRDDDGIAIGGVRTPSVDVPKAVLSGDPTDDAEGLCVLLGSTTAFTEVELEARYGSHAEYAQQFDTALDAAVDAGFIRAVDRAAYTAEVVGDHWSLVGAAT